MNSAQLAPMAPTARPGHAGAGVVARTATVVGLLLVGLIAPLGLGSAQAAGTYTVVSDTLTVRTGPGTSYAAIGTVQKGASFTLLCQWQGGTSVGGNSTWDKVTFANGLTGAIADYWTSTPSFNSYAPGTGDCNAAPPAAVTREMKAHEWAKAQVGRTRDSWGREIAGWCARWSVGAYGRQNAGYNTAYDMYKAFQAMGLTRTGSTAPAGTFVFFSPASVNGYAGHVAIATGDGRMITTPAYSGQAISVRDHSYAGANYLGWSYAPSGWTR